MSLWSRVRGLIKGTTELPSSLESGAVLPDLSLWMQFQRIGGSVTPAQVSDILRDADVGITRRLCDLGNEMRQKDGHLHSVLQTRETALADLPWELVYPGQDPKSADGAKERDFVRGVLQVHPQLRQLLAHLMGSVFNGYGVAENMWGVSDGRMVPERFKFHSPRRFGFRQADGAFVWRDIDMSQDGIEILKEYPDKFIVARPRINGDVPCREGLIRGLMWLALFRNWTLADWLKLAEIAWKPWRLGEFKKSASKEDIAALQNTLQAMSSSAVATFPETVKVALQWPEGGGGGRTDHMKLFEVCGGEMSKAVLGQTLTTEQGKVGSHALGKVHDEIRLSIRDADAAYMGEVITQFLVEPMIRLNYGPQARVPRFRFVTERSADMLQFAQALQILAGKDVQMRIKAEWARDQMGIPHPIEGDELLGVWVDTSEFDENPANETEPSDAAKPAGDKPAKAA